MKLLKDFGVRALLAFIPITGATITLSYLAINGSTEAMLALAGMATLAGGYYFKQRGPSSAT